MALGVPVVAASTRGIEDYLDAATGVVVAPPTPASLARALGPGAGAARARRWPGSAAPAGWWCAAIAGRWRSTRWPTVYAGVLDQDEPARFRYS